MDLKGDPARLPVYLELFKREFVEDPRTFAIDLSATPAADGAAFRFKRATGLCGQRHHKAAAVAVPITFNIIECLL